MSSVSKYFRGDKTIWFIIVSLAIFSLLVVYSSTALNPTNDSPLSFLGKQLFVFFIGFGGIYAISCVPPHIFKGLAGISFVLAIGLLIVTLVIGSSHNQAQRTLGFFQPAELAKIALILFVAKLITVRQEHIKDFKKGFCFILVPIVISCFLIFLSNFSTAFILGCTCFVLMFIGGVRIRHLLISAGVLVALLVVGMVFSKLTIDHAKMIRERGGKVEGVVLKAEKLVRETRFVTMYGRIFGKEKEAEKTKTPEPKRHTQKDYARIAIASGGLFWGQGPGHSNLRYSISEGFSDFVFAIIAEEWGVLFAALVLLAYLIILFRIGIMVKKSTSMFHSLLIMGIGTQITLQALTHAAVSVVDIVPVTGQNLPLISHGGSSIIGTCIMLGMLLSVNRVINDKNELTENNEIGNTNNNKTIAANPVVAENPAVNPMEAVQI